MGDEDRERARRAEEIARSTLEGGEQLRGLDLERFRKRVGIGKTKVWLGCSFENTVTMPLLLQTQIAKSLL